MDTNLDTYSITELRHNTRKLLEKASEKGYVYLLRNSKTEAALVDIEYLNALRSAYEDYTDTLEFDLTVKQKRVPLSVYKRSRKIRK
ncbi:type II toxin-antitoxin system Phd/YefM family antitoxin [Patescibacteria group bacterium]|nr:type II toxin-antitoxin system Phd/YefM family antitoxin [Patescibacteria group bacterium]